MALIPKCCLATLEKTQGTTRQLYIHLFLMLIFILPLSSAGFGYYNPNLPQLQPSEVTTIINQTTVSSGSSFNTSYNNLLGQNCPSGQVMNGTLINGSIICTTVSGGSGGGINLLNGTFQGITYAKNATAIDTARYAGIVNAGGTTEGLKLNSASTTASKINITSSSSIAFELYSSFAQIRGTSGRYAFKPSTSTPSSGSLIEVAGQVLSYGINNPQLGGRSSSLQGGIFRFDTRSSAPYFSLIRYPIGSASTAYFDMVIDNNGTIGFLGFGAPTSVNDEFYQTGYGGVAIKNNDNEGYKIPLTIFGVDARTGNQTAPLQRWNTYKRLSCSDFGDSTTCNNNSPCSWNEDDPENQFCAGGLNIFNSNLSYVDKTAARAVWNYSSSQDIIELRPYNRSSPCNAGNLLYNATDNFHYGCNGTAWRKLSYV